MRASRALEYLDTNHRPRQILRVRFEDVWLHDVCKHGSLLSHLHGSAQGTTSMQHVKPIRTQTESQTSREADKQRDRRTRLVRTTRWPRCEQSRVHKTSEIRSARSRSICLGDGGPTWRSRTFLMQLAEGAEDRVAERIFLYRAVSSTLQDGVAWQLEVRT